MKHRARWMASNWASSIPTNIDSIVIIWCYTIYIANEFHFIIYFYQVKRKWVVEEMLLNSRLTWRLEEVRSTAMLTLTKLRILWSYSKQRKIKEQVKNTRIIMVTVALQSLHPKVHLDTTQITEHRKMIIITKRWAKTISLAVAKKWDQIIIEDTAINILILRVIMVIVDNRIIGIMIHMITLISLLHILKKMWQEIIESPNQFSSPKTQNIPLVITTKILEEEYQIRK